MHQEIHKLIFTVLHDTLLLRGFNSNPRHGKADTCAGGFGMNDMLLQLGLDVRNLLDNALPAALDESLLEACRVEHLLKSN